MDIRTYIFVGGLILLYILILFIGITKKSYAFKIIYVGNDKNIEAKIRLFMLKNPKTELVLVERKLSPEIHAILEKMSYDYPKIHIITHKKSR